MGGALSAPIAEIAEIADIAVIARNREKPKTIHHKGHEGTQRKNLAIAVIAEIAVIARDRKNPKPFTTKDTKGRKGRLGYRRDRAGSEKQNRPHEIAKIAGIAKIENPRIADIPPQKAKIGLSGDPDHRPRWVTPKVCKMTQSLTEEYS